MKGERHKLSQLNLLFSYELDVKIQRCLAWKKVENKELNSGRDLQNWLKNKQIENTLLEPQES